MGKKEEEEMSLLTWKFFCGETCFCQIIPSLPLSFPQRRSVGWLVMSRSHVIPRFFGSVF